MWISNRHPIIIIECIQFSSQAVLVIIWCIMHISIIMALCVSGTRRHTHFHTWSDWEKELVNQWIKQYFICPNMSESVFNLFSLGIEYVSILMYQRAFYRSRGLPCYSKFELYFGSYRCCKWLLLLTSRPPRGYSHSQTHAMSNARNNRNAYKTFCSAFVWQCYYQCGSMYAWTVIAAVRRSIWLVASQSVGSGGGDSFVQIQVSQRTNVKPHPKAIINILPFGSF